MQTNMYLLMSFLKRIKILFFFQWLVMNNWVNDYVQFDDFSNMTGMSTKMAAVLGSAAASYLTLELIKMAL